MKRVLITGGSGFIAQYLLRYAPADIKVAVTIRDERKWLFVENNHYFPSYPLFLEKEIAPQMPDKAFDLVIHTAAMASLAACEKEEALALRINSEATAELAEWCAQRGVRLFYLSTDIVFKGDRPPYTEKDQPEPVNVYGWSKWQGELALQRMSLDFAIGRVALVLGRGMGFSRNFTDWFLERLNNNQEIPLFRDEIRTPSAVAALAGEIWRLALSAGQGIFHLAGAEALSRLELGRKICAHLGRGEELLKAVTLSEMDDYARPPDVSLRSTRRQSEIPPVGKVIGQILEQGNGDS